jgi:hypothetical protein
MSVYDWICDRKYRAQGLAMVTSGLMWSGIIEGYRIGHRASELLQATASDVWGNLRWLWQVGQASGGSWAGPLRWGLCASLAGMVWFIGVGAVEYCRRGKQ